jgi:pimeloyl-ACP methyl ester carboxylesterase
VICSPRVVSFEQHAADAAALLNQLGISRAHIAGHSTGAAIAMQMAVDSPQAVHSLALLEPPLMSVPSAGAFLEEAGRAVAAYNSGDGEGAMASFLALATSLDWETCQKVIEERIPGGVAGALNDAGNFFISYLPALGAWEFGETQAAAITRPVLSVRGTETAQLFIDSDALLHTWFPYIEDCRIEGVAHRLHIQQPDAVSRGLADFFGRYPMKGIARNAGAFAQAASSS